METCEKCITPSACKAHRRCLTPPSTETLKPSATTPCSAGALTAEMIREMEGHLPFEIKDPPSRWQWCADYLNETIRNPVAVCECCNIARDGEIMDHLSQPNA